MRRSELINAFQNVNVAINASNVQRAIVNSTIKDRADLKQMIVSLQAFARLSERFSANEKKILEIFGLERLEDAAVWQAMITGEPEGKNILRALSSSLRYFLDYLPNVLALLRQDHVPTDKLNNDIGGGIPSGKELLTVILPEEHSQISSPERLVKVLDAISKLYECIATMLNIDGDKLAVAAIDSGSDKSFDFIGAAKLMEEVRKIILDVWDKVVYYREKKLVERINIIGQSLPIIQELDNMSKAESIGKEQAELLKRRIIEACQNFITAGAVIPEFEAVATHNPRMLMAPEPKLITAASAEENSETQKLNQSFQNSSQITVPDDEDDLSEEDIARMKEIIAKKERGSGGKDSRS